MCGRYSIYESMDHYLKELAPKQLVINGYDLWPVERYNVAPSTRVEIIRPVGEGLSVDKVKWGWAPFWAKGKRPDPINARVETVMTGKFFNQLWPNGRVLAPANGWFEWVKDPDDAKKKHPYFITLKELIPMFFAGLAEVHEGLEPDERDGFVIITPRAMRAWSISMTGNHWFWHLSTLANGLILKLQLNERRKSRWNTADQLPTFIGTRFARM